MDLALFQHLHTGLLHFCKKKKLAISKVLYTMELEARQLLKYSAFAQYCSALKNNSEIIQQNLYALSKVIIQVRK